MFELKIKQKKRKEAHAKGSGPTIKEEKGVFDRKLKNLVRKVKLENRAERKKRIFGKRDSVKLAISVR